MNNLFLPYEESLELKELGFDEPYFRRQFKSSGPSKESVMKDLTDDDYINIPLYSQAFKFFREKYDINVMSSRLGKKNDWLWYFSIDSSNHTDTYKTYEEAELVCVRKLIEICKEKEKEK
jgi:hypothetical protein